MNLEDLVQRFYGSRKSLKQVYDLALKCKDLPGDFVECGIAMGSGIAAMKRACPHKKVWGYDSFQGIQLAGPNDTEQPGIGKIMHDVNGDLMQSSGVTVHTREQVNTILYDYLHFKEEDFTLVEGWVQDTLPDNKPEIIAFLRLDMDLYDPTLFALKELYPLLVDGGVLLIDDYGSCSGVAKACIEYFEKDYRWRGFVMNPPENPVYLIK